MIYTRAVCSFFLMKRAATIMIIATATMIFFIIILLGFQFVISERDWPAAGGFLRAIAQHRCDKHNQQYHIRTSIFSWANPSFFWRFVLPSCLLHPYYTHCCSICQYVKYKFVWLHKTFLIQSVYFMQIFQNQAKKAYQPSSDHERTSRTVSRPARSLCHLISSE